MLTDTVFSKFHLKVIKQSAAFFLLRDSGLIGKMVERDEHLGELQAAIKLEHKCKPTHQETVFVHEKTDMNETVWRGCVEVFDIVGDKRAKTCYAWRLVHGNEVKIITVLGSSVITSAKRAVQAAIFIGTQPLVTGFDRNLALIQEEPDDAPKSRLSRKQR